MTKDRKSTNARRLCGALALICLALAAIAPNALADFGIRSFEGSFAADKAGAPATRAGSHPYALGATLRFNTETRENQYGGQEVVPTQQVRDIDVELPSGLIGDPSATPKCPVSLLTVNAPCPADTQIGVAGVFFGPNEETTFPLYNVATPAGVPGLLGFEVYEYTSVSVAASVRPAEPVGQDGYGLDLHIHNIPQTILAVYGAGLTFYGKPEGAPKPFVTMPTSCSETPLTLRAHA